jgi:hypothetical protein
MWNFLNFRKAKSRHCYRSLVFFLQANGVINRCWDGWWSPFILLSPLIHMHFFQLNEILADQLQLQAHNICFQLGTRDTQRPHKNLHFEVTHAELEVVNLDIPVNGSSDFLSEFCSPNSSLTCVRYNFYKSFTLYTNRIKYNLRAPNISLFQILLPMFVVAIVVIIWYSVIQVR